MCDGLDHEGGEMGLVFLGDVFFFFCEGGGEIWRDWGDGGGDAFLVEGIDS